MAKADYNVADRVAENGFEAEDVVTRDPHLSPDADSKAAADTAGVRSPEFIDYDTALGNYAARGDIESLADRRARDSAADPADQNFMRERAYAADGTAEAAPRPGTVFGDADASA